MRISQNEFNRFLEPSKSSPPAEEIKKARDAVERFFYEKKKFFETDLSKRMIALIARNLVGIENAAEYQQLEKGAAMLGNVGTGKTMLLKLAAFYFDSEYFSVSDLSVEFSRNGAEGFWSLAEGRNRTSDYILDDLGSEQVAKNYGNMLPVAELIYSRYDAWQRNGSRLWLSSNLTAGEINDRYGDRVTDRLREMCEIVPVVSESMRKPTA